MTSSHQLKQQVKLARALLDEQIAASKEDPLGEFFTESLIAHTADLEQAQRIAEAEEQREVVELKLIGPQVDCASVPLNLLSKLIDGFYHLVTRTAYQRHYGLDASKGIPAEFDQLLDLRLSGIGKGSTRLFITGDVRPDLTGESLLDDTLRACFNIFSKDANAFSEALTDLGSVGAARLSKALGELVQVGIGLEVRWQSVLGDTLVWEGRYDEIIRVRTLLEGHCNRKEQAETLYGEVELIGRSGRLVLVTKDQGSIRIRFARHLLQMVQPFHIGDQVEVTVKHIWTVHPVSLQEFHQYTLNAIYPLSRLHSSGQDDLFSTDSDPKM